MSIQKEMKFRKEFKGSTVDKVTVFTGETLQESSIKEVKDLKISKDKTIGKALEELSKEVVRLQNLIKEVLQVNEELKLINQKLLEYRGG